MQQSSDLVFIFSSTGMIPLSPRSPQLKRVPHILIFVNERNAPLPKDIFDAAHRFHRLKNVAILYQTAGLRETLGHCTVLHLEGCMQRLRPRGEFDGRSINRLVEWRDLSQVDLGSVLQRLVLRRNPRAIPLPASEIPPSSSGEQSIRESRGRMGVQTDGDEAFPAANSAYITATEETESETLAANRVRRISELFTTGQPGAPAIIRLQEELRTEHRRNSRIGVAVSSIPSSPQEPFIVPTPSPNDDAFRGECQLCCEEDTQLVFLLKESLSGDGWLQNLPWPLSVGAEPVNDVISAFLCCDNCSYYVIEMGSTPIREKATGAFSLIPYTSNTERWKEDLCKGFVHYGHSSRDLLPLVLLTVVDEILRSKSWAQLDGSDENELRRNALLWTRRTVLEQVHIKGGGHEGFLGEWICSEVLRPGKEEKSMVWNYPLKGFRLFLRIAGEREAAGIRDRAERLGKVLWRRLLMEVTRCYRAELAGALDINFDATLRTVVRFSRVLRGEDDTGNWLRVLDEKKVLPEGALEVLDALEEEMEWVLNNCRYAMVKWLSWVPEALGVKGSTGEVMRWIVDVQCGDVVVMCPEDVDQSWCMGFGAEAELMSRYVYSRFGHE